MRQFLPQSWKKLDSLDRRVRGSEKKFKNSKSEKPNCQIRTIRRGGPGKLFSLSF